MQAPRRACSWSLGVTVLLSLSFGLHGVLAVAAAALVWFAWRWACLRRLGGFTGDTAGALAEMVEVAVLVAVVAR
jgi:adenosylcobinamide-GDP ribazoletransferase